VSTRTGVGIHDTKLVRCSICMVRNLSVSYNEHELLTWIMREAIVSVGAPLERLLVCIWAEEMGGHQ